MIQNRFLAKRNLSIVQFWFYYLEFIFTWLIIAPNARAVHDLEVFYEISIFHNTYLCTQNVVKQIYKFVNGVKAWFSCLKFIFTWPNIVSKITVVHHLQVFYPHFPQCFCIYRQNDLKQIFSKTKPLNGKKPLFPGLEFIFKWLINVTKDWAVHHLKVFLKIYIFHNTSPCT